MNYLRVRVDRTHFLPAQSQKPVRQQYFLVESTATNYYDEQVSNNTERKRGRSVSPHIVVHSHKKSVVRVNVYLSHHHISPLNVSPQDEKSYPALDYKDHQTKNQTHERPSKGLP